MLLAIIVAVAREDEEPEAALARRGPITISYLAPWRLGRNRATYSYRGLSFEMPILLTEGKATLVAGMLGNAAPVPGGLPPGLGRSLADPIRRRAELGKAEAVRYAGRASDSSALLAAYVVPTDRGDVGVVCAGSTSAQVSKCAGTAGTLQLRGLDSVGPGADPDLVEALKAPLRRVGAVRDGAGERFRGSRRARAAAAGDLAEADRRARRELTLVLPEQRDRAMVKDASSALKAEAAQLDELARLAPSGASAAYAKAAASAEVADSSLRRALGALRRAGFRSLPQFGPLRVPALPEPRSDHSETATTQFSEGFSDGGSQGPSTPISGNGGDGGSAQKHEKPVERAKPIHSGGVP